MVRVRIRVGTNPTVTKNLILAVFLGFTSRYWVHWDAKPKRSGRDIRFYVPVKKDGA